MSLINIHWIRKESLMHLFEKGLLYSYERGYTLQIKSQNQLKYALRFKNVWVDFDEVSNDKT